uniref:Protein-lysine N-methyltransferase n=1 Tax=Populus davidiana TaxID=266767 RepID=A0A6M2E982_9ROSI
MEEEQVKPQNDTAFTEDDDDPPTLSSHALAALKEFLQQQQPQPITDQTSQTDGGGSETGEKVALVAEDWRLSQFWYEPLTAETVANEVLALLTNPSSLAVCIACPTLYAYIKKIDPSVNVQLLEYDKRFEQYGSDFTFYDYNKPEDLPGQFKHAFQVVVADPPYLSQECLEKVAQAISFLAIPGKSYLLLLTGDVQKDKAAELLGLHSCGFRPQHSSKLGNEFRLFTNYDPGMRLGGWELEK